ncbi:MAG: hypothetical protein ACREKF_15035, partial [Candidatus Methylomirabilales bacterium]
MRRLAPLLALGALGLAACGPGGVLTRAPRPAIPAADVWGRAELVRLEDRPTDPRAYYHFSLGALAEQRGDVE